ncbi:MFS transporter [Bacillus salacetis]|uniref:MFS transporter n=1 Tax=Bacillus salacetis TaxID=2315464 RepID=A0A3A1QPG1_9BACI|nr:MFS transporter [Bacillus salacetis]RIW27656.1 MFS transporter [Bacillus salacetis]
MKMSLSIFKNRSFLFYWISTWISSIGDSVFVIALTWFLVEETHSPSVVGTYLFILGTAKILFVLVGGVIVDRIDPKKLLIHSNLLRAVIILLALGVLFVNKEAYWIFYIIGAIFGMVDSIAEPAGISFRTRIIEKEHYTQSMGLLMTAGNVSAVIGPMIGAGLVAVGSTHFAIMVNAVTFLISTLLLLLVKTEESDEAEAVNETMWKSVKSGFHYFLTTPIIMIMAVFAFFANAAVGAALISIPFLAEDLAFGVKGFGLMNTAIGAGSVIGAVLFSVISIKNPKPYMTLLTCFLQGAFIMLIGFTGNLWVIITLIAIMGLHETAVNVIAPSVNHTIIPQRIFGRVISVMILVMSGSIPIAQAAAGWLMEWTSPQEIFVFGGIVEMGAALLTFSLPFVRNYGRSHVVSAEQ